MPMPGLAAIIRAHIKSKAYAMLDAGSNAKDIYDVKKQIEKNAANPKITAALNLMRNGRTGRFTSALRIADMTAARKIQEPQLRIMRHVPADISNIKTEAK